MAIWQAIVLGLVQGLSEFLPISSTGHLTITGRLMGVIDADRPEEWTAFLAVVQLGTLLAVLAYFRRDIVRITRGFLVTIAKRDTATADDRLQARLGWLILLATIPIVVFGLALRNVIEGDFTKSLWVIASTLLGLAVVLWTAELFGRRTRGIGQIGWREAAIVGAAQVVSLIPGSSRSGTTIAGGLFAGLTREAAARFSFLLSILAIIGSALYQLPDALDSTSLSTAGLLVSIVAAAISGFLAIAFLLRYLQRHSTHIFIWYRIGLGLLLLLLLASGVMNAL
ncbi:MAG: undecaprenyl-diphosphatase UppP [Chloroflexi bacterium]|nr:undecaprenyl-diphosphatase UppP [Chloroflexota bacterium]